MTQCLFFRVLSAEDKGGALARAVAELRAGADRVDGVFAVDPQEFSAIPGTPFAYWASEGVRRLFRELPPFEGQGRTVKVGLQTSDDFRFVRAWWEVAPERIVTGTPDTMPEEFRRQTFAGKRWVPFAKGGEYSPYYADLHLVVNWERDGEEIRNFRDPETGRLASRPQNVEYYFRPGLTWPRRTNGLSFRVLPAGAIFADKGPTAFVHRDDSFALLTLAGVMNSSVFHDLMQLLVARVSLAQSFEVGLVQILRVPPLMPGTEQTVRLADLVLRCIDLKRRIASFNEISHLFVRPALLGFGSESLREAVVRHDAERNAVHTSLTACYRAVNSIVCSLYRLNDQDSSVTSGLPKENGTDHQPDDHDDDFDSNEQDQDATWQAQRGVAELLSYALGCVFGRWDIRYATGARPLPELSDPFAPLPACPPGMLLGPGGLPARPEHVPPDYPIPIQWDGILPDDEGHPQDLIAQVRRVLAVLFPGRDPTEVEAEVCQILGARDLRSWFSNEFFPYHIKQYSRSRRKAPIYWQLRSARKSYSLWLYYHRITGDTLWLALRRYVDPKVEHEQGVLADLRRRLTAARQAGASREERALSRQVERQEALVQELLQFRADLQAVAELGYDPDRDDGVLINIAPLHRLVPWSEASRMWQELQAGKYPWSTMAQRLAARKREGK